MRNLRLEDLINDRPGLTAARGAGFAQAAAVCLELNDHRPGVELQVDGDWSETFEIAWTPATAEVRATWADFQEATEHGSYGLAILIAEHLTGLTVVERSAKSTGFDYWLGNITSSDLLFQNRTKLEVSGILQGEGTIAARVRQKLAQVSRYEGSPLVPAFVVVVDYRPPKARMVRR